MERVTASRGKVPIKGPSSSWISQHTRNTCWLHSCMFYLLESGS